MDEQAQLEHWLNDSLNRERQPDYSDCKLDGIHAVLNRIGRPRPVTIAGTKGKGSALRMLECALLAAGTRCIAFTSPHVTELRERWRLDGEPISWQRAWQLAQEVDHAMAGVALSYFERCFAMAVVLAQQTTDALFLCEVGLGGRLDCANALSTRLALVTHLSLDHTQILGEHITDIAREKLAIARPEAPLLVGPQHLIGIDQLHRCAPDGCPPRLIKREHLPPGPPLALPGAHQHDNAALAFMAARELLPDAEPQLLRTAIADASLAARCQLIQQDGRRILIDAAHNDTSLVATLAVAETELRPGWWLILGLALDKDIDRIHPLIGEPNQLIRCGYNWPRARAEAEWPPALRLRPYAASIRDAMGMLPTDADVCISGSFYLAGEALALLTPYSTPPG